MHGIPGIEIVLVPHSNAEHARRISRAINSGVDMVDTVFLRLVGTRIGNWRTEVSNYRVTFN